MLNRTHEQFESYAETLENLREFTHTYNGYCDELKTVKDGIEHEREKLREFLDSVSEFLEAEDEDLKDVLIIFICNYNRMIIKCLDKR